MRNHRWTLPRIAVCVSTVGRPSEFTPEIGAAICDRLANGETLVAICGSDKGMPDRRTLYRWMDAYEDFRLSYARARVDQADAWHDELLKVARGSTPENVQVDRLLVDTLKWTTARANPARYGDRQAIEHTGANGEPLHAPIPMAELLPDEQAQIRAIAKRVMLGATPASAEPAKGANGHANGHAK